jgi:hypothetical protein
MPSPTVTTEPHKLDCPWLRDHDADCICGPIEDRPKVTLLPVDVLDVHLDKEHEKEIETIVQQGTPVTLHLAVQTAPDRIQALMEGLDLSGGLLYLLTAPSLPTVVGHQVGPIDGGEIAEEAVFVPGGLLAADPDMETQIGEADMIAYTMEIEYRAGIFAKRWGVDDSGVWTDQQLDAALAHYGYPPLASLPDGPTGRFVEVSEIGPDADEEERHQWRRTNGAHLLGHQVMHHKTGRCDSCRDW